MNQYIKDHLVSALQTFVAAFFTALGASLSTGTISFTWPFLAALLLTAVRTAVKMVFEEYAPASLGGKK